MEGDSARPETNPKFMTLNFPLQETGICRRESPLQAPFNKESQLKRDKSRDEMADYSMEIAKKTTEAAFNTYRNISIMNIVMFAVGIGLFASAGILSAVFKESFYGFVLGGLGGADFIAWFMYRPMKQSQQALSDLIQASIIYQNYYNQERIWERVGYLQYETTGARIEDLEKMSEALHRVTSECVELAQKYIENSETQTSGRVPSAPQALSSAIPTRAEVALHWKAPRSNGGSAITAYKIYRNTESGGEELLATVGNVLNYIDKSAHSNQTYYYKVSAVNCVGEGKCSHEVGATPQ